jgi:protein O-GlcNAc transferase
MRNTEKPGHLFSRLVRRVQASFDRGEVDEIPAAAFGAAPTTMTATAVAAPRHDESASTLSGSAATELINEGLRERREHGVLAAKPYFERAAILDPSSHVPVFMLGNVASELGDLDTAVSHYERARDLHPTDYVVRYNLGLNQMWRGYVDEAIEQLRVACQLNPSYLQAQSSLIMALHNSDKVTPEEIASVTREWGQTFVRQNYVHTPIEPHACPAKGVPALLRIGFLSGDFRTHSVAHFFEPIVSAHDRSSVHYTLYSTAIHQDTVTARLRACADDWRDVARMPVDELVNQIRNDKIDILVDLAGHTEFNRLAALVHRVARVQVSYLGYPDSTGLPSMDFRITDEVTDPEFSADAWHCERLLRLPTSQWCFRPYGSLPPPGPLPARDAGFVTFGSFNSITKVSDTTLLCWARILVGLPEARLRLTRLRSPQRCRDILDLFGRFGVAPERLEFVPYRTDAPYGSQFDGVDIALDPYPYNGVTTTCESLYFGVPVISLHGRNGVSRSGLSILRALDLEELAASSPDEYVQIAIALAGDVTRLESLRSSLRARFEQSSLRDEKRFAANFEELLRMAWRCSRSVDIA